MDKPISGSLRTTFLVHMIIAAIFGAALWLVPGRTLTLVGWVPATFQLPGTDMTAPGTIFVNPGITRLLGAALLALAFSSYRGWRARQWGEVAFLVQLEALFCVLALVALLVPIVLSGISILQAWIWWVSVVILVGFIIAWGLALRQAH
jgi:hypothetical protein